MPQNSGGSTHSRRRSSSAVAAFRAPASGVGRQPRSLAEGEASARVRTVRAVVASDRTRGRPLSAWLSSRARFAGLLSRIRRCAKSLPSSRKPKPSMACFGAFSTKDLLTGAPRRFNWSGRAPRAAAAATVSYLGFTLTSQFTNLKNYLFSNKYATAWVRHKGQLSRLLWRRWVANAAGGRQDAQLWLGQPALLVARCRCG